MWAALSIVLALETRRKTGRGQHIDVAMYECMVSHIESNMNHYHAIGEVPGRSHDRMATAGVTFRAKDGYVVLAGARTEDRLRSLWQTIGRDDLAQDPRFLGGEHGRRVFRQRVRACHRAVVGQPEQAGNRGESWCRWASPWAWRRRWRNWRTVRTWKAAGCTWTQATRWAASFRSPRTPVRLTACVETPAETPPTLGQHNREVLCSIGGMTPEELEALEGEGTL